MASLPPGLTVTDNALFGVCGDGRVIAVYELRHRLLDSASQPLGEERAVDSAEFGRLIQSSRHS